MLLIPLDTILFFNDTFPIVGLTNVVIILKVVDFPEIHLVTMQKLNSSQHQTLNF